MIKYIFLLFKTLLREHIKIQEAIRSLAFNSDSFTMYIQYFDEIIQNIEIWFRAIEFIGLNPQIEYSDVFSSALYQFINFNPWFFILIVLGVLIFLLEILGHYGKEKYFNKFVFIALFLFLCNTVSIYILLK